MIEEILLDLERKINDNYFSSKEQLIKYINEIRSRKDIDIALFNDKVGNILNFYDEKNIGEEELLKKEKEHSSIESYDMNKDNMSSLMPLNNLNFKLISKDMLNKIKFFISNINDNINNYQVDIINGIFLNTSSYELYEVTFNKDNNLYQINIIGNEKQHGTDNLSLVSDKPKTRVLRNNNNKAFIKTSLLFIVIITFSIVSALLLLFLK